MSVLHEALAQAEESHKREIAQLKEIFQTELALLKQQLSAHQASITNTGTKSSVEEKLDMIMKHLQLPGLQPHNPDTTFDSHPSPPRKRRDQTSTPTKPTSHYDSTNDDTEPYPETTLNWDSDDEEDNLPSSQDDAMALSGSED